MSTSTSDPTKGLEAWEAQRKAWTTPNQQYLDTLETRQANNKYDDLIQNETQRKYIYKKIVHQRQNPLNPISLKYIIPILVTGWQEDGLWPKGMVVQEASD